MSPYRKLWIAALLCVAVNGLATLAMAVVIRKGTPLMDPSARVLFLRLHATEWRMAWAVWPLAALSLVYFYVRLRAVIPPEDGHITGVAVLLAAAGLIPDISAEMLYLLRYPGIADLPSADAAAAMERYDRACSFLTGLLGNGAYTLAWIILALVARGDAAFPRSLVWGAFPGILAGLGLCVAAVLNQPTGMAITTGVLMPAFLLWCIAVGLWARGESASIRRVARRADDPAN